MAGEIAMSGVDVVGVLQRAVAALPEEERAGRALALGALAENGYWVLAPDELDRLSGDALRIARQLDDPGLVARTLHKRIQVLWRAATFEPRREAVDELLALAQTTPEDTDRQALAWYCSASISWEDGDVTLTAERVERARALADRTGTLALVTQLGFMDAAARQARGDVRTADDLIEEAYEVYRRTRRWAADPFRAGHRLLGLMEQDRLDDIVALAPLLMESVYGPVFGECVAYAYHELGAPELAPSVTPDRPALVDAWLFLGAAAGTVHNRVRLGDLEVARQVGEQLAPYAGRLAVVGTGPCLGDVHTALAVLARAEGDRSAALAHLDASVERLARGGALPWLVRSLLLRHEITGDADDLRRAEALVATRDLPLLRRRVEERQAVVK
jgi:hypothetical protein